MSVTSTISVKAIAGVDCIHCSIRRLSCDRTQPSCDLCLQAGNPCSYEWRLGDHIYQLFPGKILNSSFKLDLDDIVHRTHTARIYKAQGSGEGIVAVKVLWESTLPARLLQLSVRESWTWSQLQHVNIVPLLGIADFAGIAEGGGRQLCMISPWMEAGNIMDYIEVHPDTKRLRLLWDIVKGVSYLHSLQPNPIIHGDLKGNNVLVDLVAGFPRARLTDFGLSHAIEELSEAQRFDSTSTSYLGNPRWLAFERLFPTSFGAANGMDAYSIKSDIFEMMRTFLQVLTGQPPFYEVADDMQVISAMQQGGNPKRPAKKLDDLDEALWRLMLQCWERDRSKRPPLMDIWSLLEHRVLTDALTTIDDRYIATLEIDGITASLMELVPFRPPSLHPLLGCLERLLIVQPQHLAEDSQLLRLVKLLTDRDLLRTSPASPLDLPRHQEILHFLACLARCVPATNCSTLSAAISVGLPISRVLQTSGSLAFPSAINFADVRDLSALLLDPLNTLPALQRASALDAVLQVVSTQLESSVGAPGGALCCEVFLQSSFLRDRLLTGMYGLSPSIDLHTNYLMVFCNIVSSIRLYWHRDQLGPAHNFISQLQLSLLLERSWEDEEVHVLLRAVVLILEFKDASAPLLEETSERILELLAQAVKVTSDFIQPESCLQLLGSPVFAASLGQLMQRCAYLERKAWLHLSDLLRTMPFRLSYDPFDQLSAVVCSLPWMSLLSPNIRNCDASLQIQLLDNLITARSLIRTPESDPDELEAPERRRKELELTSDEALTTLPLLTGCLASSKFLDSPTVSLCLNLIKHTMFEDTIHRVFTASNVPEKVFESTARLWLWTYAQPIATPFQFQIRQHLAAQVTLFSHAKYALSIAPGQADFPRLYPLLRILAYRVKEHPEDEAFRLAVPTLLQCAVVHMSCPWVASEHGFPDLIQNAKIVEAALGCLTSDRSSRSTVQGFAVRVIVAAYRLRLTQNEGNNYYSSGFPMHRLGYSLPLGNLPTLYTKLKQGSEKGTIAAFWELVVYRIDLEAGSQLFREPHTLALMSGLVASAVDQVDKEDAEDAYAGLLFLQYMYKCSTHPTSTSLPIETVFYEVSLGVPAFLATRSSSWSALSPIFPRSPTAPLQVDEAFLSSFIQEKPSFPPRITSGKLPLASPESSRHDNRSDEEHRSSSVLLQAERGHSRSDSRVSQSSSSLRPTTPVYSPSWPILTDLAPTRDPIVPTPPPKDTARKVSARHSPAVVQPPVTALGEGSSATEEPVPEGYRHATGTPHTPPTANGKAGDGTRSSRWPFRRSK